MAVLAVATALTVLALEIELVLVEARSTVLPHDVRGAVTLAGAPVASQPGSIFGAERGSSTPAETHN